MELLLTRHLAIPLMTAALLFSGCSGCITPGEPDGGNDPLLADGGDPIQVGDGDAGDGDGDMNAPPEVVIDEPADGISLSLGVSIALSATVTDLEDGTVSNTDIAWTSDLDGALGIGASVVNTLVSVGVHTITCTATDSAGASGSASITVTVVDNFAPVVTITAPADGSFHASGAPIAFSGAATDAEDGTLSGLALTWWSGSTQLGSGAVLTTALPDGAHTIELRAEDSAGTIGSDAISLQVVQNLPPVCTVSSPSDGDDVAVGQTITFEVTCTDPDGSGPIANAEIAWSSSLDGALGLGASVQNALTTVGDHVISVCAPDTEEPAVLGCTTLTLTVAVDQPPEVAVLSPASGSSHDACTAIALDCSAVDPEAGLLTVGWTSDVEGAIAADSLEIWVPSVGGAHTLTCSATDAAGNTETAQVSITVPSPVASITAPDNGDQPGLGEPVNFTGSACAAEDGPLTGLSLGWTSSLDGVLGSGSPVVAGALNAGAHLITLTATDSQGGVATASIDLFVNALPEVTITTPVNGEVFTGNPAAVALAGTATDAEDGTLTPTWAVSGLGDLGTGASLMWATPPPGIHQLSLRAVDSLGAVGLDAINVQIEGADPLIESLVGPVGQVSDIVVDPATGALWFATSSGLYGYDPGDGTGALWTTYDDGNNPTLSAFNQASVVVDPVTGDLGVADDQGFAVGCDPATGPATMTCDVVAREPRPEEVFGLDNSEIQAVLLLSGGRILVGGRCLLFATLDQGQIQNDRVFCEGDGGGDGLVRDRIRDLVWDETRSVVWVATDEGVSAMVPGTPNQGGSTSFTTYPADSGLGSNDVRAIAVAPSGDVYFATAQGLSVLDAVTDTFRRFRQQQGMPSGDVRDVAVDVVDLGAGDREVAWAATAGGLGRVDVGLDSVQALTTNEGLPTNDCVSIAVDAAHTKWVGTNAGVFLYRGY